MPDRTINFGESETEATYQIQDTDGAAGGGNFVVAKDTNANTVLLEYDPASDTWEYAGDVDMNGGNVSGIGTLTADSVNTGDLKTPATGVSANLSGDQSVEINTIAEINIAEAYHTGDISGTLNASANAIEVPSGYDTARITVGLTWDSTIEVDVLRPTINGSLIPSDGTNGGLGGAYGAVLETGRLVYARFTPLSVSGGDLLRFEIRQKTNDPAILSDTNRSTFVRVGFS